MAGRCKVWAGSGSKLLALTMLSLSLPGFRALNQVDLSEQDGCKVWVWVWLEASSSLRTAPELDASNPEQVDLSGQAGASRPSRCKVWAGSGSRLLVLIEIEPSRLWSLEPVGPVRTRRCKVWVWVWLESSSFLQMEPWLDASNPEHMDQSKPDGCKFGLVCLEASMLLRDRAFSRGGRPGLGRAWEALGGPEQNPTKGGEGLGYLIQQVDRAAHNCLWDWELRRHPCLLASVRSPCSTSLSLWFQTWG